MLRRVIAYWEPSGAVLEEWAARIQAEYARMVDAAARVPILAGRSRLCRAWLLQGAGTIVLLALGLLVSRTVAWVLLGFPMTVLVWLFLVDIAERCEAPDETQVEAKRKPRRRVYRSASLVPRTTGRALRAISRTIRRRTGGAKEEVLERHQHPGGVASVGSQATSC